MGLTFYNQLTKKIDNFTPLNSRQVTIYTCGPTVYSYPTIGNWVAYIYWDVLVRLLVEKGYKVNRVMNITDVGHLVSDDDEGEDKLIKGAKRDGKSAWEIADFYSQDFISGMEALNLLPPTTMPRATAYISEQLDLVKTLKEKGYTYQIDDGIYFDTAKFKDYNKFAGIDVESLRAGARVEYNPAKRNPSDFALWKFSPKSEKRDMEWQTPTELLDPIDPQVEIMGFPGWHLECSAMAMKLLGETIDIHTGGIDHIPVHHPNEIAQSEAATDKQFARYWLHNNHLKVDGTKISKSLGNGYSLQDIVKRGYDPLDLKMLVLQSHYQTEGNFTFDNLEAARNRRLSWVNLAALRHQIHNNHQAKNSENDQSSTRGYSLVDSEEFIIDTLSNNLNTPGTLSAIDQVLSSDLLENLSNINPSELAELLETIDNLLGLKLVESSPDISDQQKQLLLERQRYREQNDYKHADRIRTQLEKDGITINDTPHGQIWQYI